MERKTHLSFTQDIPAQIEALKYANNMMKKISKFKIYLRPGRKYCCLRSDKFFLKNKVRILKVLNYDGPRFSRRNYWIRKFIQIKKNTYILTSQESIIGRIMEQGGKLTVVTSTERTSINTIFIHGKLIAGNFNRQKKPNQKSEIVYH